jgi:hypothetical protein
MNPLFSREGRRKLRDSVLIFATCVALSAAVIAASHAFLQKEKRDARAAAVRLQEARARVDRVRRERDSLEQSADLFRALIARGLMQPERRLDLVELMNGLRARHGILALDYEIAPQRALALAGGRAFPAVDILASRVTLKLRALHEGDALAFIDSLGESRQGFYPVDRCVMRRLEVAAPDALQPRVEADCTLEWITMKEKRVA